MIFLVSNLGMAAQERVMGLQQRHVRARQDSLRVLQGFDLTCTSGNAGIEVLDQPIALSMQIRYVLVIRHCLLERVLPVDGVLLESCTRVSLDALFLCEELGIVCPLR